MAGRDAGCVRAEVGGDRMSADLQKREADIVPCYVAFCHTCKKMAWASGFCFAVGIMLLSGWCK